MSFIPPKIKNARKQWVCGHYPYCALPQNVDFSGAGEDRTPVQTYSPKAFYMLISLFIFDYAQEKNKPMRGLAAPNCSGVLSNRHSLRLQHPVFVY